MAKSNWKGFYGRAMREALERANLNSRSKVALLIVVNIGIAAGLWWWTGKAGFFNGLPTRILTVAVPFALVLAVFLWRAIALGPEMFTELEEERGKKALEEAEVVKAIARQIRIGQNICHDWETGGMDAQFAHSAQAWVNETYDLLTSIGEDVAARFYAEVGSTSTAAQPNRSLGGNRVWKATRAKLDILGAISSELRQRR